MRGIFGSSSLGWVLNLTEAQLQRWAVAARNVPSHPSLAQYSHLSGQQLCVNINCTLRCVSKPSVSLGKWKRHGPGRLRSKAVLHRQALFTGRPNSISTFSVSPFSGVCRLLKCLQLFGQITPRGGGEQYQVDAEAPSSARPIVGMNHRVGNLNAHTDGHLGDGKDVVDT